MLLGCQKRTNEQVHSEDNINLLREATFTDDVVTKGDSSIEERDKQREFMMICTMINKF